MKKSSFTIIVALLLVHVLPVAGQVSRTYKEGIVVEQFIFEKAPFPSSHAATIAEANNGTLVASWFGGTYERDPDVCIYVSRCVDGRWTEPQNVADGILNEFTRWPTWNPVLYQVPGGDLQLFYKIGERPHNWQGWMKTSPDGGITWSDRVMLPAGYAGPIKNKPVLVGNQLFCPSSSEHDGWRVHFEVSSDFGKTWRVIGPINDGKETIAIQPSLLTYADGRLQVLCRSKNRAVLESWSADGGETWSAMAPTNLPNNNSGTDAVSLSDGRQLLVYNHVLPPGDHFKGIRTPINVAISENGKDWYAAIELDHTPDDPKSEFSYPAVIQSADGMVHILYTWKRSKIKHVVIDPSKIKLTKIINGNWPD